MFSEFIEKLLTSSTICAKFTTGIIGENLLFMFINQKNKRIKNLLTFSLKFSKSNFCTIFKYKKNVSIAKP